MKKTFVYLALMGVLLGGGWIARPARAAETPPTYVEGLHQGDMDDPPMAFTALGQDTDTWSILFFDPGPMKSPIALPTIRGTS